MDPNTTLDAIRTLAVAMAHEDENLTGAEVVAFADAFLALDEWLRKGGFLPQPWQAMRPDEPRTQVDIGAREPGEALGRPVADDVDTELMDRAAGFTPEDEETPSDRAAGYPNDAEGDDIEGPVGTTGYPAPGAGPTDPDLPVDPDDDPTGPPYFGDNLRPSRRRPPGDPDA